jgi:hypothetical protein
LLEWLGPDFDGVILFDEAHAMRCCRWRKSVRRHSAPSQQGIVGRRIANSPPRPRDLRLGNGCVRRDNLAYATRLGLWGGADFPIATASFRGGH